MVILDSVLVRYGEIALKDPWTRNNWERILASNIAFELQKAGIEYQISRERGRIFVHTRNPRACGLIANVFGVVSVSPVCTVRPNIKKVSDVASELALGLSFSSFAIRPRRAGGKISSNQLGVEVGKAVQNRTQARVDLDNPELEIFVEARNDKILVFTKVTNGVGGLPLGSQPRMLALISGGIDSPVAAWMMMRRGCPISLIYFDVRPYAGARSQAMKSTQILKRWTSGRMINLVQVPIGRGLEQIAQAYPRATCILCRRLMYRIAGKVMKEEDAFGIVTGYSLGQVASQTPANIMAEQSGIDLPIYHPLIALDKSKIMEIARKIGTYRATECAESCKAAPKKPMTQAKIDEIKEAEDELGLKKTAQELFEKRTKTRI
ncbi:MAG: tRNA uracil 4-sulfurtransferase ThiI [Methanotrichaceae archaeon]